MEKVWAKAAILEHIRMIADEGNAQDSLENEIEKAFKYIIEKVDEEDYEQCSAISLKFIEKYPKAKSYLPYACYLKLFSEAYRTWQISYDYTPIRSRFGLAYRVLERSIKANNPLPEGNDITLLKVFEQLSAMLCAYTWCENSFINSDPFALRDNSKTALIHNPFASDRYRNEEQKLENETLLANLKTLSNLTGKTPYERCQIEMASWLCRYLKKNELLHEGLHGCAELYIILLQEQRPLTKDEETTLENIQANQLRELRDESAELSSELNAHICHIREHNKRVTIPESNKESKNTYLRINKGLLVNQMSVAFDADLAQDLFLKPEKQREFRQNIEKQFEILGVDASGFQVKQLHDIFQTSFGESSLKTISIDLRKKGSPQDKEIKVEILDAEYYFDVSFSLSALGVCTLYFKLGIDKLSEKGDSQKKNVNLRYNKKGEKVNGLRVEEARVLQSLICPHAGQVKLTDSLARNSIGDVRVLDSVEFPDLIDDVASLRSFLEKPATEAEDALSNALKKVEDVLQKVEEEWIKQTKINEVNADADNNIDLSSALTNLKAKADSLKSECPELKNKIDEIFNRLVENRYFAQLAKQYFSKISDALSKTFPTESEPSWDLKLATDTGWFTYLYCYSIDEIRMDDNESELKSANFDQIVNHPDMVGFFVEQREARASFDDWRFIKHYDLQERKLKPFDLQERNLAHIRSHETDGFFCTEYQAFIYFPDDPMFLTDQYEATVKLMVRLATVLRYNCTKAQELADNIHTGLHAGREFITMQNLNENLDKIRRLRLHAKAIQTLVARSAISRYKDHGDLMKRILCEMKLDTMVDLLNQQLKHLSDLYGDVGRKVAEKWREVEEKHREDVKKDAERRESKVRRAVEALSFLGFIVALSTFHDLVESIFYIPSLKTYSESWLGEGEVAKGKLTLIFMGLFIVICTMIVIAIFRGRKQKEVEQN